MSLYMATICADRGPQNDRNGSQVVVHWDDNDPNTAITGGLIMYGHPITDEGTLAVLLRDEGWTVVSNGSDNIGRGWAIVRRTDQRHPFFNPMTRSWCSYLTDDDKRAIRATYPDATIPDARVLPVTTYTDELTAATAPDVNGHRWHRVKVAHIRVRSCLCCKCPDDVWAARQACPKAAQ